MIRDIPWHLNGNIYLLVKKNNKATFGLNLKKSVYQKQGS